MQFLLCEFKTSTTGEPICNPSYIEQQKRRACWLVETNRTSWYMRLHWSQGWIFRKVTLKYKHRHLSCYLCRPRGSSPLYNKALKYEFSIRGWGRRTTPEVLNVGWGFHFNTANWIQFSGHFCDYSKCTRKLWQCFHDLLKAQVPQHADFSKVVDALPGSGLLILMVGACT